MSDQPPVPAPVPDGATRPTLLSGTIVVAIGLAVTGVGTLVMLGVAARNMPGEAYADFVVWWTVATLLGTSFGVFEVYLARLLIGDFAPRTRPGAVDRRDDREGRVMAGVITAALAALAPVLSDRLFSGEVALVGLLAVFMSLTAMQALQRGAATGRHDMVAIATQLSVDGVARGAIIGVLAATGNDSVHGPGARVLRVGGAEPVRRQLAHRTVARATARCTPATSRSDRCSSCWSGPPVRCSPTTARCRG